MLSRFGAAAPIILSVLLTACSSAPAAPPAAAPTSASAAAASSGANAARLLVAESTDLKILDPAFRPTTAEAHATINIYDGLVELDQDLKLVPGLATSWTNKAGTTWEFKLRPGVTFSDGEPFNADTVVAWFQRLKEIKAKGLGSSAIDIIPSVTEVAKVDDATVDFQTNAPDPTLPRRLAAYFEYITPAGPFQNGGDPKTLWTKPIGTGPYMLKEQAPGDHVTLVANPKYWGPPPKIQEVEIRVSPDDSSRAAALKSGQVGVALDVPIAQIEDLKRTPNLSVSEIPEAQRTYWFYFNTVQGGPLADQRVRQAINYAVDKRAILDKVLDGQGKQTASIVTSQSFGFCDVPLYPYDPAKAKQLLQEAGVSNFQVPFTYSPGHYPAEEQVAQAIGNFLTEVGITPQYTPKEFQTALDEIRSKKAVGMWYSGKTNLALDADYQFGEFQGNTLFGWSAPMSGQAEELYQQEKQELDDTKRAQLACQIQQQERDAAPVLYLWQGNINHGVNTSKVHWTVSGDGFLHLDRITPA
jgi:peptide/nickel transport system substrate-binding protein